MMTILIEVFLFGVPLAAFAASAILLVRIPHGAGDSLELHALFLMDSILGVIFCVARICQMTIGSGFTNQLTELSTIVLAVFLLNLALAASLTFFMNASIKKPMAVRPRAMIFIFILFLEFVLIGSFWSMFYFYKQAENVSSQQSGYYLDAVASSRAANISTLINDYRAIAGGYTTNGELVECLQEASSKGEMCNKTLLSAAIAQGMLKNSMVSSAIAIDKDGIVIGSNDGSLVGQNWSARPEFLNHSEDGYFSGILPGGDGVSSSTPGIIISMPVMSGQDFLGVLSVHVRLDEFYAVLNDRTSMGDTGETYLVNSDGELLSPRRFTDLNFVVADDPDAAACATDFARYATEGSGGTVAAQSYTGTMYQFNNQFGRSILGVDSIVEGPVAGMRWCVVAEIGQNEIQAPLQDQLLKAALVALIVLMLLICIFISIFNFFFKKLWEKS
jgi:C4-dicarboxylate-specific signal transduction histidine kinase